jgi:hypothetical protein
MTFLGPTFSHYKLMALHQGIPKALKFGVRVIPLLEKSKDGRVEDTATGTLESPENVSICFPSTHSLGSRSVRPHIVLCSLTSVA